MKGSDHFIAPEGIVRAYTTVLLVATLVGAFAAETSAQVTKPRNPLAGGRFPAPARVSASQQPDGKIRVVWSSVDNATKYALIRSVPPVPAAAVALPNPSDTVYVDSDVKPGSSYYYVVSADNEERVGGMKRSSPPVKALAEAPVSPPRNVHVSVKPYPYMAVSWSSTQKGVDYTIERAGSKPSVSKWEVVKEHNACCLFYDDLKNYAGGVHFLYRVTAVDSIAGSKRSEPVVSNEVVTQEFNLGGMRAGWVIETRVSPERQSMATAIAPLNDQNMNRGLRWVSMDEKVVSFDSYTGSFIARHPGSAYVVAMGLGPRGQVMSMVYRITVTE